MTRAASQWETTAAEFPWGAAAIIVVLAVLFGGLARLGAQPLRLELYGSLQHTDVAALSATLEPLLQEGFFAADAEAIAQAIEGQGWVRDMESERLWPNRLAVRVQEHVPLALVETGGVLMADGSVIDSPFDAALPRVRSTPQRLKEIAGVMQLVAERCADCELQRLELREGNQLRLTLAWDGQAVDVELGRPDWAAALRRLTEHALPELRSQLPQVAVIDMRHRHAYAVRWRPSQQENHS